MTVNSKDGSVEFFPDDPFDPAKIFDCGQCFRFEPEQGGFCGIAFGRKITVKSDDGKVIIEGSDIADFENIWYDFFDLGHSYNQINRDILEHTPEESRAHMKLSEEVGLGIRILRQDPWETLISFIISQNNNIPRIKKLISALCRECGEKFSGGYAFPSPEAVNALGEARLTELKFGFRAGYIADAARRVCSGDLELLTLYDMSFEEAFSELCRVRGIGSKVASCVLLFAYGKLSAFPIDVWIRKVIDNRFGGITPALGEYAGVAQQYLFYYERYNSVDQKG